MNRVEKRAYIHNTKRLKGLNKKRTKGAFGKLPQHIAEERVMKIKQKIEKTMKEELAGNTKNEPKIEENTKKDAIMGDLHEKKDNNE